MAIQQKLHTKLVQKLILTPSLQQAMSDLHDRLSCADDQLDAEARFVEIAARIRAGLGEAPLQRPDDPGRDLADALRAYLDAHLFEPITLAAAAVARATGSRP